jgi:hypothetical protein
MRQHSISSEAPESLKLGDGIWNKVCVASIGLILRADDAVEKLPVNWQPEALGSKREIEQVLWTILGCRVADNKLDLHDSSLALELRLDEEPIRCITVSGVFGYRETELIQRVCTALSARFYDAETGDFTL